MPKIIQLVKSNYVDENGEAKAHSDGLYKIAGFINRSYFCDRCCKEYDHENAKHHNCLAQNCPACLWRRTEDDPGCKDFKSWTNREVYWKDCYCWFYGQDCLNDHLIKKPQAESAMMTKARKELIHQTSQENPPKIIMASICESRRKCKSCQVTYKVNPKLPHKCLHSKCKNCLEYWISITRV